MYRKGQGVAKDYKEAVNWYRLAAEQGHAHAQNSLGASYLKGYGVPQDYETAVKWHRLAAEQGHAHAQFLLGTFYVRGKGVPKDLVYAHMWANLAASNGSEGGEKARDLVARAMTPAQIAEAQKLARKCVRKKYKGC